MPIKTVTAAKEDSSCQLRGYVKDPDNVAIPVGNISAATLEIVDKATGTTIRAATSIISDIDSSGYFDTQVTALENAMVATDDPPTEIHVATMRVTGTSGDGTSVTLVEEIWFVVENNRHPAT